MENNENKSEKNIWKQAQQIIIPISGILGSILVIIQIDEKTGFVPEIWNGFQQFLENTHNTLAAIKSIELGFIVFLLSFWLQLITVFVKFPDQKDYEKELAEVKKMNILYAAVAHSTIIIISYWVLLSLLSLAVN